MNTGFMVDNNYSITYFFRIMRNGGELIVVKPWKTLYHMSIYYLNPVQQS